MRRPDPRGIAATIAAFALAAVITGCGAADGAATPDAAAPAAEHGAEADAGGAAPSEGSADGGADRERLAESIEAAFATQNGAVSWRGDVLVLEVDGDADAITAA